MRETRRFKMYPCSDLLFLYAEDGEFSAIGQVKEIGLKGVVYQYIYDRARHPKLVDVDVFSRGKAFHLGKVPCRLVYNMPGNAEPFSSISTRICGLRFEKITADQERALWIYISKQLLRDAARDLDAWKLSPRFSARAYAPVA